MDIKCMKKSDFYYELPDELIAQTPIEPRNASRMLVADRRNGFAEHSRFYNLCDYLRRGDLLVLNDSRVIPARIFGKRCDTGSFIEFLLLEQKDGGSWEILTRPGKRAKIGKRFVFGDGILLAEVTDILPDGNRIVRFEIAESEDNIYSVLEKIGQMPLPPYITEKLEDKERYQTVYSHESGSAAAPTAGLHFTKEMLSDLESRGINVAYVTLHVGLGTFRPVKEEFLSDHKMHSERYEIGERTARLISQTKRSGGRVIAVGTTSCRTLESAAAKYGEVIPCGGRTDIFIYPGFKFRVLDGLITNFHLPESTLIMLVSAFMGYENTMECYKKAVEDKYRFFSFGDAMLILDDIPENHGGVKYRNDS